MPMWANFDPRLGLSDDRKTVDARGPLHWDTDPSATRIQIEVTITDNEGHSAHGVGLFAKAQWPNYWRLPATTRDGETMAEGGASALGIVTRVKPSPDTPWQWSQNVTLG